MSILSRLFGNSPKEKPQNSQMSYEEYQSEFENKLSLVLQNWSDDRIKTELDARLIYEVALKVSDRVQQNRLLKLSAELGKQEAGFYYCMHLANEGLANELDRNSEYYKALEIAAATGEHQCLYNLGVACSMLDNPEEAFVHLYKSALQNDRDAMVRVMRYCLFGHGTKDSVNCALYWLIRLFKLENPVTEISENIFRDTLEYMVEQTDFLVAHENGINLRQDCLKEIYSLAAQDGEPTAMAEVALADKDIETLNKLVDEGHLVAAEIIFGGNVEGITEEYFHKALRICADNGNMFARFLFVGYSLEGNDTNMTKRLLQETLALDGPYQIEETVCAISASMFANYAADDFESALGYYYYCKCKGDLSSYSTIKDVPVNDLSYWNQVRDNAIQTLRQL